MKSTTLALLAAILCGCGNNNSDAPLQTAPPPASEINFLRISPVNATTTVGGRVDYSVFAGRLEQTSYVRFRSSNPAVASVRDDGRATGLAAGTTEISASLDTEAVVVMGQGGGTPQVYELSLIEGDKARYLPYPGYFQGGVRVATGDVNGDGIPDTITAPGSGAAPQVKVFSGKDQSLLLDFLAFPAESRGGVFVAAGDVNGDGRADVVVGAREGGTPEIRVFSGLNNELLASFLPFGARFGGGIRVAAGDLDGDGRAEIVTGSGAGGGPVVKVFSGARGALLGSFLAYSSSFQGGVRVATGDINGDNQAEIVTGPGPGLRGEAPVRLFDGVTVAPRSTNHKTG